MTNRKLHTKDDLLPVPYELRYNNDNNVRTMFMVLSSWLTHC